MASKVSDTLWFRCNGCGEIIYRKTLESNFYICNRCGYHFRITPDDYIKILLDEGTWEELDPGIVAADPLKFPKYPEKVKEAREKTGRNDAFIYGRGRISNLPVVFGAMDFSFIGGSMGSVVGEKVARAIRLARTETRPLVIIATSGGARMQEGILSLMQMAKTSAELGLLRRARVPFISIPIDPCTAGVMASFASLGDVIISEPGALLGFAGQRVIEDTIGQKLPEGFQRAEFMLKHGLIDIVCVRRNLKETVTRILTVLGPKK
ncbi:MAG: acetyl-CoA carboxylase, carboxyltransferase subunit beta [candidate division WOR-3 bacterium]|jgi:acetyl-CoA carboxylase carboxyl transferase subunit beta|nr:acetyl-CoA carboxylase, carboxyltransferase subunit beta [candidate division WOR-3 bacterium]MCR4424222.1 acetyl-CoA carboxylase, carboxyltransferase subunit beta [candidate division WOR-3 bacterium]MDH7519360.1 acetyl-CoA carboxylase, carboxyltransferase subunit beta [bacterium]